jgi:hypothetical protein
MDAEIKDQPDDQTTWFSGDMIKFRYFVGRL